MVRDIGWLIGSLGSFAIFFFGLYFKAVLMPTAMDSMLKKVSNSIAAHRELIDEKHPSKDDIQLLKKDIEETVENQTKLFLENLNTKVQAQDKTIDRLEQRVDDLNKEILAILKS